MAPKKKPSGNPPSDDDGSKKPAAKTTPPPKKKATPAAKHSSPSSTGSGNPPAANWSPGSFMDVDSPAAAASGDGTMNAVVSAAVASSPRIAAMVRASPSKPQFDPNKHLLPSQAIPVKKDFLASLGIKSVKAEKASPDSANRNCVIIVTVTPGPVAAFNFWFENQLVALTFGPWTEKLTVDAVRANLEWTQSLGIQQAHYKLNIDGEEVRNNRGYAKRVFCCPLESPPTRDAAITMAKYIADCLNATPGNSTTTLVDEDRLFPFGSDPTHWSNFVGIEAACRLCLERSIGSGQVPMPGYWESHSDVVRAHFGEGELSPELARFFHAPATEE